MRIFVIMPFAPAFDHIREAIRSACIISKHVPRISNEINKTGRLDDLIIDEIRHADACLVDLSGMNPNVMWEMGYAQSMGKAVAIITQNIRVLPFDVNKYATIEYQESKLDALTNILISLFKSSDFTKHKASPSELAMSSTHQSTSLALAAERFSGAPYDFNHIMARAESHVFIIAQNHFFFVEHPDDLMAPVLKFLKADPSRRFSILMCDVRVRYSVRAWMHVTASRYGRDLEKADHFFLNVLVKWADSHGILSQITVKRTPFVPISMTFVDPYHDNGIIVLTPNIYERQNNIRPFFVISKRYNSTIFDRYFEAYNAKFTEDYSIDNFSKFINYFRKLFFRRLWPISNIP